MYEEFSARFRRAWEAARDHFRPTRITRQGLRYIDHLEGGLEAGEWAAYINEELLGPLRGVFGSGLEQAVSELRFRRDDGILVFKHGILPSGPEGKKGYLLDFDYFSEEPSEDVSVEAVSQRFDLYHEVQYAFFRWCVTDQAIQEFRRGR